MRTVTATETRANLAELLEAVAAGEEVLILRRGRPVARLLPLTNAQPLFASRRDLRDAVPPMREGAEEFVRALRSDEQASTIRAKPASRATLSAHGSAAITCQTLPRIIRRSSTRAS